MRFKIVPPCGCHVLFLASVTVDEKDCESFYFLLLKESRPHYPSVKMAIFQFPSGRAHPLQELALHEGLDHVEGGGEVPGLVGHVHRLEPGREGLLSEGWRDGSTWYVCLSSSFCLSQIRKAQQCKTVLIHFLEK